MPKLPSGRAGPDGRVATTIRITKRPYDEIAAIAADEHGNPTALTKMAERLLREAVEAREQKKRARPGAPGETTPSPDQQPRAADAPTE
jgi:hypothetical protein